MSSKELRSIRTALWQAYQREHRAACEKFRQAAEHRRNADLLFAKHQCLTKVLSRRPAPQPAGVG